MATKKNTSAKTPKNEEKKVQQTAAENPVENERPQYKVPFISAKIDRFNDNPDAKIKANASVTIGNHFAVHGLKIYDGDDGKGPRVMYPATKGADKGDMGVIDAAIKKLEKKRNLVIFPEGTRSYTGKVGRGKTGVALIAAKAQRDVIPVGIIFDGPKLKPGAKVVVKFGKPIKAAELAISENPDPRELKALKLKIMSAITELVEGDTTNASDVSSKEITENE